MTVHMPISRARAQAVPYWVDDATVRPSMIASAKLAPAALNDAAAGSKARTRGGAPVHVPTWHPVFNSGSTMQIINPDELQMAGAPLLPANAAEC
jgi:hypothetical protein